MRVGAHLGPRPKKLKIDRSLESMLGSLCKALKIEEAVNLKTAKTLGSLLKKILPLGSETNIQDLDGILCPKGRSYEVCFGVWNLGPRYQCIVTLTHKTTGKIHNEAKWFTFLVVSLCRCYPGTSYPLRISSSTVRIVTTKQVQRCSNTRGEYVCGRFWK